MLKTSSDAASAQFVAARAWSYLYWFNHSSKDEWNLNCSRNLYLMSLQGLWKKASIGSLPCEFPDWKCSQQGLRHVCTTYLNCLHTSRRSCWCSEMSFQKKASEVGDWWTFEWTLYPAERKSGVLNMCFKMFA